MEGPPWVGQIGAGGLTFGEYPLEGLVAKESRRFSTEFKVRLVESYLAGDGSIKGLATQAGIDHSLLHYWVKRDQFGEPTLDVAREEAIAETGLKITALERKVGPLTIELELLKGGLIAVPATNNARLSK